MTAERSAASLIEAALQNNKLRAETILEVARQRGNEKEIAEAQIAVWRIELQINEAQAEAARKEAEAILLVVKARRAELEASDALAPAKRAELEVMEASAKAKQLEAEKYDLLADRMRKLPYETNELKSSFGDLSSSADQAAASADRAAASYEGLSSSIRAAGQAKDGFVRDTNSNVVSAAVDVDALAARHTCNAAQAEAFKRYFNKGLREPKFYSSTQGLDIEALVNWAAEHAAAEAWMASKGRQDGQADLAPVGMGNILRNVASGSKTSSGSIAAETRDYTVTLNLNGKASPVKVTDQASVDSLIRVLEEMQRASR